MKEYPVYWKNNHDHLYIRVPDEECKRRKKCFFDAFSALLDVGFIKKGNGFYRLYGEEIIQVVEYNQERFSRAPGIRVDSIPLYTYYILCRIRPEVKHWYTEHFHKHYTNAQFSMEDFSRIYYPGTSADRNIRTTYFEEISDFDEALCVTQELFFERTLPILQNMCDTKAYMDYFAKPIRPVMSEERPLLCATWVRDWELAYKIADQRLISREATVKNRKEDPLFRNDPDEVLAQERGLENFKVIHERVYARDTTWLDDYLYECLRYGYNDLNNFSPRIMKLAYKYKSIINT